MLGKSGLGSLEVKAPAWNVRCGFESNLVPIFPVIGRLDKLLFIALIIMYVCIVILGSLRIHMNLTVNKATYKN